MSKLDTPVEYLKGVGPHRADILKKELGIFTANDLLHHFPFRYSDRSTIYPIKSLADDMPYIQVSGILGAIAEAGTKATRLTAQLTDETGSMDLVWFKGQSFIKKYLQQGQRYVVYGKPALFGKRFSMVHPEMELWNAASDSGPATLRPVYSSTEKLRKLSLDSRGIELIIRTIIAELAGEIQEIFPQAFCQKYHLVNRKTAYYHAHFPADTDGLNRALHRLKFEEFFMLQWKILSSQQLIHQKLKGFVIDKVGEMFNSFYHDYLPFSLTNAQKRVVKEIHHNMKSGKQMNRLVQGDVGSGKTLVALLCMLLAIDNSMQAALMAPTEILAQQHFITISKMLDGLNIRVELLTGSTKKSARNELHEGLRNGTVKILIGTHALIEDEVQFANLGLVVIDEQHRFGVAQRARLWKKNSQPPHVLVMTATPIPRTLAMTIYGDLDTSVIDELPPGRKSIKTFHYFENKRLLLFDFIKKEIDKGRQVYIVYPLIDESETLDINNLMEGYESIERAFPQPQYQVSIVHGRMKPEDKDFEMNRFKKGETNIMVATTVIEVGVDVPNASIMVIENAERFGLSQLHQLRGRVGRGAEQSYCFLLTGNKLSNDARKKMATMVETTDGFKIAEVDMELRGPGEISGTMQSGLPNLKIGNLLTDSNELQQARQAVQEILNTDPHLQSPEHRQLKLYFEGIVKKGINWGLIS